ncbi:MAG: hypothetical protein ACHQF3_00255 [Alphaproteobacteria bacterium]
MAQLAQNSDVRIPIPGPSKPAESKPAESKPGESKTLKPGDTIAPGGVNASDRPIIIVDTVPIGQTEAIIGAGVLVVLMIAFFFLKQAFENNLIAAMARPRKAAHAAWLLFITLTVIAATVVFGYLAKIWLLLPVFGVLAAICVLLIIVFMVSLASARRSSTVS